MTHGPSAARGRLRRRWESGAIRPRDAGLAIAVFWLGAIVIFGVVETIVAPKSFDTVWDGLWWAVQTVTTVGYGDVVPASAGGKALGAVLMIGGLSLLSVLTALITSSFVEISARRRHGEEDGVQQQLDAVNRRLEELQAQLARLER